jgi:hypothetical protein
MKATKQQQKSFEKLRAVCPETKMIETRTIGYLNVLTCDNFAQQMTGELIYLKMVNLFSGQRMKIISLLKLSDRRIP